MSENQSSENQSSENQSIDIRLAVNQFINEKKYWTGELSGELSFSSFPGDKDKKAEKPGRDIFSSRIDGNLSARLIQMSGGAAPNLHIILSAAVIALSQRYTGIRDIIAGTAVDRQENTGKLFNTVLPLRIRLDENMTFKQLIVLTKKKVDQAIENQNYPIEYLVYEDLQMKKPASGFALFDIGILLKNLQEKKYIEHLNLNMLFSFLRTGEDLECEIDYNSAHYKRETVERIFTHLAQFLASAVFNVDREIAEMDILTESEKHQLMHEFNRTQRSYPDSKTIHVLFEDRVASGPHRTAIVYRDEHYSYTQVNEKANRLARVLISRGIRTDEPAAILLDRSPVMAESILAVWKAGGAYIPLDTQYPFQRIKDILSNSGAKVVISLRNHIYQALETAYKDIIITPDTGKEKEEIASQNPGNINTEIDMKGLAYIIYTSGSTGKPKGAMVEHRGMLNHIYAKIDALQTSENTILIQNASHTFDVSVWQFFTALTQGGRTVIFPVDYIFDVGMFINQTIKNQATVLEVVPSYLAAMLDVKEFGTGKFKSLEYILVTGETVPPGLVGRWFEKQPGIKMINAYGPTEASDDITHYLMDKDPGLARIPVGKPVQNLHIYIVNEKMKLCPIGVKGEICVSGIGVGRGYINDDQGTAKVFMNDPFIGQEGEGEGTRLYKTGDIGCRLPDGNIDFFGRKDYQVKLRGFRIELGEIENALNAFPGIKSTAVVDKVYKDGNKYLCAYFVSAGDLDIPGIKKYLAGKLPYYMIPAHFNPLKEFPLTPNGKIDRLALQNLELEKESPMQFITGEDLERSLLITSFPSIKPGEMAGAGETGGIETVETFVLTPGEREQILELFNNTAVDYEKHKTIHLLFEEQAARTPVKVALKFEHHQVTYAELNKRSNRLAGELRAQGVKAGHIVGLMVERSVAMLTGLLAILKAGGAYLPIGDENPGERIQFMLDDCRAGIVLSDPVKRPSLANYNGKFLDINREASVENDVSNPSPACEASDLAYVIYTSGTTGTPKGVMIENRAVINFIKGITDIIEFNEYSVILSLITVSFDIFVLETIVPLTRGCRVVIGNKEAQANVKVTGKRLMKENITTFQCTPTMLQRIVSDDEAAAGLQRLQYLLVGGEIFRAALLDKVLTKTNGKVFNLYGPTETTVWSTVKQVTGPGSLNIGKPIANTQVYILNEQQDFCPIGVSGELCIGGDGVAGGYLNRPELTYEKFKKHRSYRSNRSYISFYKTGDLARWLPDGNIEFLGRRDHQIKINGIRIELAEIESILSQHPGIDEAVVVVKEKTGGTRILCAYLVSQKRLMESETRLYLSGKIPAYMIPNQFVQLEKMPLTPSGKADRKLLAAVEIAAGENYAAPRNDTEKKLKEIWETTLGTGNIGIKDNFFNIGGDSIKSINLVNKLNQEFKQDLKIRDIFQNETIEKLAEKISKQDTDTGMIRSTGAAESSESNESAAQYDQVMQELEAVKNKFMKRKSN